MLPISPASNSTTPSKPKTSRTVPAMRRHCRGGAVVRLDGHDVYLGRFGSEAAEAKYNRVVAEWLASGGRLAAPRPPVTPAEGEEAGIDLAEIVEKYLEHCERWYRRADGTPTGEAGTIRQALRPLVSRFVALPAAQFGPKALKILQEAMITEEGWCRHNINRQVARIKAMFKWAVAEELIPAMIYHALQTVRELRAGKSAARETEPVRPVPQAQIDQVLPFLSRQVGAMIRLQLLSGARPGEICRIKAAELNMTGRVWIYEPNEHKTKHHGKCRRIPIGPKAQDILRPFLVGNPAEALFRPCDALRDFNEARQKDRKLSPSAKERRRRQRSEGRAGKIYSVGAFARAIARACDQAFPPPAPLAQVNEETIGEWKARLTAAQRAELRSWRLAHRWAPNQLRHNAATVLRAQFGAEAAQIAMGHSKLDTTEIYAERDWSALERIISQVG